MGGATRWGHTACDTFSKQGGRCATASGPLAERETEIVYAIAAAALTGMATEHRMG